MSGIGLFERITGLLLKAWPGGLRDGCLAEKIVLRIEW
jgi:hypothetical protein